MIKLKTSAPREFLEQIGDWMQDQNGWDQIGMVGFDPETWKGVTGEITDILRYLADAQERGAEVAVITFEVKGQSLDVTLFVESVPEWEEEVLPADDPGEVLPELPGGGPKSPEGG